MIRLSRILNLNFPSRLTQDEIDALPKIKFFNKTESTSSLLLVEKCPICLTEFNRSRNHQSITLHTFISSSMYINLASSKCEEKTRFESYYRLDFVRIGK